MRGVALSMTFAHWCYWSAALLGVPDMLNRKTISGSIDALAQDSSGMGFGEFEAVIMNKAVPIDTPQLQMLFNMYDTDKSGSIDSDEVKQLIEQMRILFPGMDQGEKKTDSAFEVTVTKPQQAYTS